MGLSPRGRGNRHRPASSLPVKRSIPAWAGEPGGRHLEPAPAGVYPRVGGGTRSARTTTPFCCGLSPRGRGNQFQIDLRDPPLRSIPAWAGEPFDLTDPLLLPVYPRVGGGTTASSAAAPFCQGLSPRGRGNPDHQLPDHKPERSIPAWAGEPSRRGAPPGPSSVYPRVGGGTTPASVRAQVDGGLSPRGRGNREAIALHLTR